MRVKAIAAGLALVTLCWGQPPAPGGKDKPSPASKAEAEARSLAADLREARELLKKAPNKQTREQLELVLSRAELRAIDLQKALAALAGPAKPVPTAPEAFAKVLKGLKAESFDKDKLAFLKGLGGASRYTSEQARELLQAFSFDDHRVTAALLLHPRLTDPGNFFTALEAFSFKSNRDKVREKLKIK
jgi:hypothetical protein